MSWFDWATGWIRWDSATLRDHEKRLSILERKALVMGDVLDTLKDDFEAYKAAVDAKLTELGDKLKLQLDPAKAQLVDDEINAAKAALNPPSA